MKTPSKRTMSVEFEHPVIQIRKPYSATTSTGEKNSYYTDVVDYLDYVDALKDQYNLGSCYCDLVSMLEADLLGQTERITEELRRWMSLAPGERESFLASTYLHNGTACLVRRTWDTVPLQVSCFQVGDAVILYAITQFRPINLWETWESAWVTVLRQTGITVSTVSGGQ
jgi:hypothetical protein